MVAEAINVAPLGTLPAAPQGRLEHSPAVSWNLVERDHHTPPRRDSPRRRYDVNERFFERWSAPMAWVLGLLHSSGHVAGKTAMVRWQATKEEPLVKVRACLESTHPILSYDRGEEQPTRLLIISRQRIRADIDELVSARLQADRCGLPDVPPQLLHHFLRGYLEGKGFIHLDETKARFTMRMSGNSRFLEDLRQSLHAAGFSVPRSVTPMWNIPNSSVLTLSARRAFLVADFLYREAPAELRLTGNWCIYERCRRWREQRGLEVGHAA